MNSGLKRYHVVGGELIEGEALGRITVVLGADYENLAQRLESALAVLRQSSKPNQQIGEAYANIKKICTYVASLEGKDHE